MSNITIKPHNKRSKTVIAYRDGIPYRTVFTLEKEENNSVVESAYLLDPNTGKAIDTIYATTENGKTEYRSHSGKQYNWEEIQEVSGRDHYSFFH